MEYMGAAVANILVSASASLRPCQHHCLANSTTFQNLVLRFPGPSKTKLILQDFLGPGNCTKKSMTFQEAWEP